MTKDIVFPFIIMLICIAVITADLCFWIINYSECRDVGHSRVFCWRQVR